MASYEIKVQNIITHIKWLYLYVRIFDIFVTFPPLDFRESAEFNKNKDQKDINWFTKHFAHIFWVQKLWTSYIATFVQGAAIAQSLQGFIGLALCVRIRKSSSFKLFSSVYWGEINFNRKWSNFICCKYSSSFVKFLLILFNIRKCK